MSLKDELVNRVTKLQERRAELVVSAQSQLADLDAKLGELKRLLANWDTLTIEQGLTAAAQAGLRIRVDA